MAALLLVVLPIFFFGGGEQGTPGGCPGAYTSGGPEGHGGELGCISKRKSRQKQKHSAVLHPAGSRPAG